MGRLCPRASVETRRGVAATSSGIVRGRTTGFGTQVARVAASYREQVLLDWACYRDMANRTVGL